MARPAKETVKADVGSSKDEETHITTVPAETSGDQTPVMMSHPDPEVGGPDGLSGPVPRWAFDALWVKKGWVLVGPASDVADLDDPAVPPERQAERRAEILAAAKAVAETQVPDGEAAGTEDPSKVEPADGAKDDTPSDDVPDGDTA